MLDVGPFLRIQGLPLALRNLVGVEQFVRRLVVGRIFVEAGQVRAVAALDRLQMPLQGGAQRPETAGKPPPVDRHHEPDRRPLGGRRLIVGARDVRFDRRVQVSLRLRHLDEAIVDLSLCDRGRKHSRVEVPPQERAGMACDEMPNRRVRAHQVQGGTAFGSLQQPSRNPGLVAQGAEHLVGLQRRKSGNARGVLFGSGSILPFHRLEQPRHAVQRLRRRVRLGEIVEEREKRLRRPFRRQPQQAQQIPYFDGMHLHGRRGEQYQALGTLLELPHQAQQRVRPAFAG